MHEEKSQSVSEEDRVRRAIRGPAARHAFLRAVVDCRGAGVSPLACVLLAVSASITVLSCGEKNGPLGPSDAPAAAFTVSPANGTTETEFLVDASGSSDLIDPVFKLRVRWDWENNGDWDTGFSVDKTARHRYIQPGTKTIRVEVQDSEGHGGSTTRVVEVGGGLTCLASGAPLSGPAPLEVNFAAGVAGGAPPYSFAWEFGDGETSDEENPKHFYLSEGTHTANLTVTDSSSPRKVCRSPLAVRVSAGEAPPCDAAGEPRLGPPPLSVQFFGTPPGQPERFVYLWQFGDGDSSGARDPAHTYAESGEFDAIFTAEDTVAPGSACRDTVRVVVTEAFACAASATPAIGVAPLGVSLDALVTGGSPPYAYSWSLGDGAVNSAPSVAHQYATSGVYEAILAVTDASAPPAVCRDTVVVRVASPLVCAAAADPAAGAQPLAVAFAASADGGAAPYAFRWTFGDGQSSSEAVVTHTYSASGVYAAVLTATDAGPPAQTCRDTVRVTVVPALACDASGNPTLGAAPLSVAFTVSATGGISPFGYSWTFGDGGSSTIRTPTHVYSSDGAFAAVVTITDSDSPRKTCRDTVRVSVSNALACAAAAEPASGVAPLVVAFEGDAGGGTPPHTFRWIFGDGLESTSANPSHTYSAPGAYRAILIVLDSSAPQQTCRDTVAISATAPMTCEASASPASGVAPLSVAFQGSASGGVAPYAASWAFGDGASSTASNPSHAYAASGAFAAVLTITDSGAPQQTCRDTVQVTANPPLSCAATAAPPAGPAPLDVAFQGSASGGVAPYAYAWTFGDGESGSGASPAHTYDADGAYVAILSVTDSGVPRTTCRDTLRIVVSDALVCGVAATPSAGPAPLAVRFVGSAAGGVAPYAYSWAFGEGAPGSGPTANHTYATTGTRTAVLTVTDSDAPPTTCRDTLTIVVGAPLSCDASGSPTRGPTPLTVAFQSSAGGGSAPYSFDWRFGDGGFSFAQNPSHAFVGPGTYATIFTVTDKSAPSLVCRDTVRVTVIPALGCEIARSPAVGIIPVTVAFSAPPANGIAPYRYEWDFGDGSGSDSPAPSHRYTSAGNFVARLTLSDSDAPPQLCLDSIEVAAIAVLTCQATQTIGAGVIPFSVGFGGSGAGGVGPYTYAWTFGDDGTSGAQSPAHEYSTSGTFEVVLTLTDAGSPQQTCRATLSVRALPPLICAATRNPASGVAPLDVSFTASGSGGVAPYEYSWAFGDGGTSTTQNPSYDYTNAGTFSAVLTVTDAGSPQQTCRDTVQVIVLPVLTCAATRNPAAGVAPLDVSFTGSGSGGVAPYAYSWAFGDGGSSVTQNPAHQFANSDTFQVVLTVTDAGSPQQACRDTVSVRALPLLTCAATRAPASGVAPLDVSFTGSGSGGVGPYTFAWAFGDGESSAAQNPSHGYTNAGTFSAVLTVTDAGSPQQTCRDTVQVIVLPVLSCAATRNPAAGVAPLDVSFTGSGSGGVAPYAYSWTLGDGGTSAAQDPSHQYATSDTFQVVLTVTDAGAPQQTCRDTVQVIVLPVLTCAATRNPAAGVAPLEVSFTGLGAGGVGPYAYSWTFGDDGTSAAQNPSHTYALAGAYESILTVQDSGAPQQTCSDTVLITVAAVLACEATPDSTSGIAPFTVDFNANGSGGLGAYSYNWEFGDGQSSASQNPSHEFTAPGDYTVVLTITDSILLGVSCADTSFVTVIVPLTCDATGSNTDGPAPLTVDFQSSLSGGVPPYSTKWLFGDGESSEMPSPQHAYADSGAFEAILSVTDSGAPPQSCADTVQVNVTAGP